MQRSTTAFGLSAILAAALAPSAFAQPGGSRESTPPNILLIVIDDIGIDQIHAYAEQYSGSALPCTPNIDALAQSGVRFTNAWSSSVCSPTRAMILTGKPGHRTGVGVATNSQRPEDLGLRPGQQTIASLLGTVGYQRAAFGKWHVGDTAQTEICQVTQPISLGFEFFSGSLYNLEDPSPSDGNPVSYTNWVRTAVNGQTTLRASMTEYATVDTTDEALAWVDTATSPWFLYVAYNASHGPYDCPPCELCRTGMFPCPPGNCAWCADCFEVQDPMDACSEGPHPNFTAKARAMTRALDAEIGRLLDELPADTAVFLIGDNGTPKDATLPPFDPCHAKGTPYQGGVNVPLIARVPGVFPPGMVCDELVCATDLLASIAELAGATNEDSLVDSVSLLQYTDPSAPHCGGTNPRDYVYTQNFFPNFVPENGAPPADYRATFHERTIRNGRYKLIEWRGTNGLPGGAPKHEMYQLSDAPDGLPEDPVNGPDPYETNNLLDDPNWPTEVQDAFAELLTLIDGPQEIYPPLATHDGGLAVSSNQPLIVREAAIVLGTPGPSCSPVGFARVGVVDGLFDCRTFIEFWIPVEVPCDAEILKVELEMNVLEGASSSETVIEVYPVANLFNQYCCDLIGNCQHLYNSINGKTPYDSESGWTGTCVFKRFDLGAEAANYVEDILDLCPFAQQRKIRVGMKLPGEAGPLNDLVEFRATGHRIYVTYQNPLP